MSSGIRDRISLHLGADHAHDGGVGERGGVSDLAALGDVAEEAAHDLARAGLGELADDVDIAGTGDRADLLSDPGAQFVAQTLDGVLFQVAALDDDESDDRLAGGAVSSSVKCEVFAQNGDPLIEGVEMSVVARAGDIRADRLWPTPHQFVLLLWREHAVVRKDRNGGNA